MFSSFTKPFSAACERNKEPIAQALRKYLNGRTEGTVLEIGAGTGQHVVHFAPLFPKLKWLPTDTFDSLPGLYAWTVDADLPNIIEPIALDITKENQLDSIYKLGPFVAVYSSNTAHIMSWKGVECMFRGVGELLADADGNFFLYGPFNISGQFTSDGNKELDAWAKSNNPESGIRDLADIEALAAKCRLNLIENIPMPANNHLLVFGAS